MKDGMIEEIRADLFGPGARFHHVGIAMADPSETGLPIPMVLDPTQGVNVGFVAVGDCRLEAVQPASEKSPVSRSIKQGHKMLHVCFEVDSIEAALTAAGANDFRTLADPVPAVAFDGRRIAWVYHPVWGLYELLERTKAGIAG